MPAMTFRRALATALIASVAFACGDDHHCDPYSSTNGPLSVRYSRALQTPYRLVVSDGPPAAPSVTYEEDCGVAMPPGIQIYAQCDANGFDVLTEGVRFARPENNQLFLITIRGADGATVVDSATVVAAASQKPGFDRACSGSPVYRWDGQLTIP